MTPAGAAGTILVIGGSGHFGRHIVRNLVEKQCTVRVVTRDAHRARAVLGDGPSLIEGDICSPEVISRAIVDVEAIVIALSAFSWKQADRMLDIERDAVMRLIDAAQQASVERIVYLSVYDIDEEIIDRFDVMTGFIKLQIETTLKTTDMNWTVLGCAPSTELFFRLIRGKSMIAPGGGPPAFPFVSPHDVGVIAAQAAQRSDLANRRIRLTGPEALGFSAAADRIGAAWQQPIRVLPAPLLGMRVASVLLSPFSSYLRHLAASLRLLNHFPPELAEQVPADHEELTALFDYSPTTLEEEATQRQPKK